MTIIDASLQDFAAALRKRTIQRDEAIERVVREIVEDVRTRGDLALLENARRFDAPNLDSLIVSNEDIKEAELSKPHFEALRESLARVQDFHQRQFDAMTKGLTGTGPLFWNGAEDGFLGQRVSALKRVGVYVPGGNAAYPSSVIMNVSPATCAGVAAASVCTPARRDGTLHPAVLVALRECRVARAFKVGGAAAVAAMALGTESVPRVDKIVGPGNRYVNEAKRQLWGTVGLDGYAGRARFA